MISRRVFQILASSLIAAASAPAAAGPQSPPPPWHEGISEDSKQSARALMQENAIDRDEGGAVVAFSDGVNVPKLIEQRAAHNSPLTVTTGDRLIIHKST